LAQAQAAAEKVSAQAATAEAKIGQNRARKPLFAAFILKVFLK